MPARFPPRFAPQTLALALLAANIPLVASAQTITNVPPPLPVPTGESRQTIRVQEEGTSAIPAHDWKPGQPIVSADDLLVALESADADINTFGADVIYTRVFSLAGDEQTRQGKLAYQTVSRGTATEPASRRFAIEFDTLRVGRRVDKESKHYIFDGEWLVEKLPSEKLFIKRQVVAPGERFDPLRIGEGPFPVPVGQRREDVLSRYYVTMLPVEDGLESDTLKKFATASGGTYQVQLIPRDRPTGGDDLIEIRVWYRTSDLLPRMAKTRNLAGDESTVQMLNPTKNPRLKADTFDTKVPERGWDTRVEPYRRAGQPATQPASPPAEGSAPAPIAVPIPPAQDESGQNDSSGAGPD
ncbi:LolA family protein [Nodularia spumigena]|uniref:LolA family protein n=1 Tax=Nodularia spumigena TaxID=70799 RepID=UPI002B1EA76B|nr:hypothetical protein [Nodularia spumigena]MEA5557643.1 hypothetical protein [Nodularia spumigena CH309]